MGMNKHVERGMLGNTDYGSNEAYVIANKQRIWHQKEACRLSWGSESRDRSKRNTTMCLKKS